MFMYGLNGHYKGDYDAYNSMIKEHLNNHMANISYDSISSSEYNSPLVLMYKLPDDTVFFITQYFIVDSIDTYFTLDFIDDILSMESITGVYSYMNRLYERFGSVIDISINTIEEFKSLFYGDGLNDMGLRLLKDIYDLCYKKILI